MNTNKIILDLIAKNASLNEITCITGLSHKQLFHRLNMLKIKGYDFSKKYYYNGDICYGLNHSLIEKVPNTTTILSGKKDNEFKAILVSDLHLGSFKDRPDLLDEVYNFCIKKGVNIILNSGDVVDGPIGYGKDKDKKVIDVEKQIEYLLEKYPFDKNILNFICFGNHDYAILKESGIDLNRVLENKRHDLIGVGYGYGILNVKNDQIILKHQVNTDFRLKEYNERLTISGHSHKSKINFGGASLYLHLPSLSNLLATTPEGEMSQLPSFYMMTLEYKNGFFSRCCLEHFVHANGEFYKVAEQISGFSNSKGFAKKNIDNEEERIPLSEKDINEIIKNISCGETNKTIDENKKVKEKSLELTQIDKFNKKWKRK